jgi:hypothetical protein
MLGEPSCREKPDKNALSTERTVATRLSRVLPDRPIFIRFVRKVRMDSVCAPTQRHELAKSGESCSTVKRKNLGLVAAQPLPDARRKCLATPHATCPTEVYACGNR